MRLLARSTSSQIDERFGAREIPILERPERDADHLFAPGTHLLEAFDEPRPGVHLRNELRELGDRHAIVGHALEMQVDVKDCQHEAKIARNRSLPCEQRLDALLDRDVARVDVVVESDHLVGKLVVPLVERVDRSAQRAQDERSLFLEGGLQEIEVLLKRRSQPNRPVT